LSAILTSAILIGKQNEPGLELKREKYIVQIERNVKNLTIILNDFLSLSKVEEGKIVAKANTFNVIHFLKSIIQESKINLKKDQKVNFHNITETLIVYLDAKLLQHIITNLLSNASKYSAENSSIDFKIFQNKENVQIEVTDDGIGIPEEEQKNLFQRFYRAKNTNNIEGTGIGLNIAKHYTELMGGNITFKSKLNKGTTFLVEFPINGKA
jgi:signal transduction histidine kinase